MIRWLFACLAWSIETIGYWIRPYDMLADRRRWRWQPRQRCGWSYGLRADARNVDESPDNMPENMPRRAIGWDEHGHAHKTGHPIDARLGAGDLQDAENCGYTPWSVLAKLDVDRTYGTPVHQFRDGCIVLLDGTILERGGTLGAVWAVTRPPA